MPEAKTDDPVQFLDLLLDYFADERRWARGFYHNGDYTRHCLASAIRYLSIKRSMPREAAQTYLYEALPPGVRLLAEFNDNHCRTVADIRALIAKARDRAVADQEQRQKRAAAAQLARSLILIRLEREQAARAAAGDDRVTYILPPQPPELEPQALAA
jgi:hypothetical protein